MPQTTTSRGTGVKLHSHDICYHAKNEIAAKLPSALGNASSSYLASLHAGGSNMDSELYCASWTGLWHMESSPPSSAACLQIIHRLDTWLDTSGHV